MRIRPKVHMGENVSLDITFIHHGIMMGDKPNMVEPELAESMGLDIGDAISCRVLVKEGNEERSVSLYAQGIAADWLEQCYAEDEGMNETYTIKGSIVFGINHRETYLVAEYDENNKLHTSDELLMIPEVHYGVLIEV